MSKTMVTEFAEFWRWSKNGEFFYYPANSDANRLAAIEHDDKADPVRVSGFGVYDTTRSTEYAVAVYPSESDAHKHKGSAAPTAPTRVIDDAPSPKKAAKKPFKTVRDTGLTR